MIQRIQTIHLLVAVIFSVVCLCLPIGMFGANGMTTVSEYNLWLTDAAGVHQFVTWPLFAILVLSSAVGLYTIFMYSNRIVQSRLCVFNILLIVGWYIVYTVMGQVLVNNTTMVSFTPALPVVCPIFSIMFYVLARRGIMADEKLVRAADRIR